MKRILTSLLHDTCVTDESEEAVRLLSRSALKNIPYFPFAIAQLANIAVANISSNAGTYMILNILAWPWLYLTMYTLPLSSTSSYRIASHRIALHHIALLCILYIRTTMSNDRGTPLSLFFSTYRHSCFLCGILLTFDGAVHTQQR